MSLSAAKRRKVSASQTQIVDNAPDGNDRPTTPRRASYLSPTKSSLARSHPHLITRSTRRSLTESRGKSLRDQLLGERPQSSEQPVSAPGPVVVVNNDGKDDKGTPQTDNDALEQPTVATAVAPVTKPSDASLERKRSSTERRTRNNLSDDPASPIILPTLVPRKEPGSSPATRARSGSPELPPTPVALGLVPQPERPKGFISSSSPRSSRKSRDKRGPLSTESYASSPLKNKMQAPERSNAEQEDNATGEEGEAQEAPESEADAASEGLGEDTEQLQEQQSTFGLLKQQMEQLKHENERLRRIVSEETLDLLKETHITTDLPDGPKTTVERDQLLHRLTLFSPGSLCLNASTETRLVDHRTKIVHILQMEAPPPWLPNALSCTFDVTVDAENVQVEMVGLQNVMIGGSSQMNSHKSGIHMWLSDRLGHPLHKLDVGGAIWGLGKWFDAAVERAIVFRSLDLQYNQHSEKMPEQKTGLNQSVCTSLAHLLDKSQICIADTKPTSAEDGQFRRKILLHWNISLDWAGGIASNIEISSSGLTSKAELELKTVFLGLIPQVGVRAAFENVWNLVQGNKETWS
jgi:hypothetical protein